MTVVAVFDRDRLDRALRFLGEARFGGLVSHLFAVRAFFPDTAGAQDQQTLREVRETLRETLDRLFIKLRLPGYTIAPRDLENAAARAALQSLVASLQPSDELADPAGSIVLRGNFDVREMRALGERLDSAALATALPWAILARFIPGEGDALQNYRDMLIASLDDLAGVDEGSFVDALQRRPYPVLDAALDVVRAQFANLRT